MKHDIFISYPNSQVDIVQNLKQCIESYGVTAWVYATDRALATDIWGDIEQKIGESDLVLFVVSEETSSSDGQQHELKLAHKSKILPLFIGGIDPKLASEGLGNINGDFLDAHNVKELGLKIVRHQFPDLFQTRMAQPWRYPLPGEWLEVINLNANLSQYFDIGDKLYFRAISPIGLFECYAPRINDCFWIAPENVATSFDKDANKELERDIPYRYTVMGMIQIDQLSWDMWRAQQGNDNETGDGK